MVRINVYKMYLYWSGPYFQFLDFSTSPHESVLGFQEQNLCKSWIESVNVCWWEIKNLRKIELGENVRIGRECRWYRNAFITRKFVVVTKWLKTHKPIRFKILLFLWKKILTQTLADIGFWMYFRNLHTLEVHASVFYTCIHNVVDTGRDSLVTLPRLCSFAKILPINHLHTSLTEEANVQKASFFAAAAVVNIDRSVLSLRYALQNRLGVAVRFFFRKAF